MSYKEISKKKVFVRTFGCQMNTRDSEVVRGLLERQGYKFTEDSKKADIIIINTCAVRQHAEDRVWSEIGSYAKGLSPKKAAPIIGLIGCMAQSHKENAFERSAALSFVVGPGDIAKIPDIVKGLLEDWGQSPKTGDSPQFLYEKRIWETDSNGRPEEIYHTDFYQDKKHAYVVISEGCSNFCSYCVVPFVRGSIRHRKHENILDEISRALAKGITKITLLGQNVNAYADGAVDFTKLLELVNITKGLKEFSFMTSHPKDTSAELFKAIANLDKLKKFLHLPLQSGSNRILKLMNRNYTKESYLKLIKDYRKIVKNGILTTDIIVGFPTETDTDFNETLKLFKKIEFAGAYLFKYSARPYTEAAKMADDVTREKKEKRHKILLEIQRENSKKYKW
ncbi:MAG: tRNA (N6-isopentenyl adenosine(37)-C2)-methylthiotransferase MiaB [Candidatus Omnitrophota bacterium]|jgi:tRNA-2-methylthio-N6-dimethylallyladenosine synthase